MSDICYEITALLCLNGPGQKMVGIIDLSRRWTRERRKSGEQNHLIPDFFVPLCLCVFVFNA